METQSAAGPCAGTWTDAEKVLRCGGVVAWVAVPAAGGGGGVAVWGAEGVAGAVSVRILS